MWQGVLKDPQKCSMKILKVQLADHHAELKHCLKVEEIVSTMHEPSLILQEAKKQLPHWGWDRSGPKRKLMLGLFKDFGMTCPERGPAALAFALK